jgi:RND family efflux transporter MFP subunit
MPHPTITALLTLASCMVVDSCTTVGRASTKPSAQQVVTVGIVKAERRHIERRLTVSAELVAFQEIDVYAKESGFVKQLLVDYGSHVAEGQLLATLEIPELQANVVQDQAAIRSLEDQVTNAEHQLGRIEAQHRVLHLEYERMNGVAQAKPGLVAQQEVDDVQGRDLAAEAQVEGAKSNLEASHSNLAASQAKLEHDRALYAYSRITAPFKGVVTQRYANLGTLLQAGTNSSTQAMPLVKLSEEDRYRLVMPVPESYVGSVKIGDPVDVRVPALDGHFPGVVARTSFDLHDATRTLHTEVDVPNPKGVLLPGVYAEATLTLDRNAKALTVPLASVDRESEHASVYIVDTSEKIQLREVKLGVDDADIVEILSGLQDGDRVVVSDRASLTPGEQVHPQLVPPASYKPKS